MRTSARATERRKADTDVFNQRVDKEHQRALPLLSTIRLKKVTSMTDQLSRVFAALADPTRRDMVARLTTGDATVGELAAPYDVSVQAVSKHLKVLEEAGLVSRTRDAQRRPVHLEAEVFDLMTKWIERYQRRAEERYQRLDAVLAELDEQENPQHPTPREGTAS
jgi:DNA-binding transcriptional ArsR family regulator